MFGKGCQVLASREVASYALNIASNVHSRGCCTHLPLLIPSYGTDLPGRPSTSDVFRGSGMSSRAGKDSFLQQDDFSQSSTFIARNNLLIRDTLYAP